jgi:hypothetical protein
MVSGTTVVQDGELVHTGWVYDDNGADTIPLPLVPILIDGEPSLRDMLFSGRTGDVVYPTDRDRYAGNAADLVEVRVRVDEDAVAFRIVLNTVREPDVAAVAIGIDTTGSDEVVDWGHGLGELGPTGVDHVVYTDGVSATLDGTPVPSTDRRRPRTHRGRGPPHLLDPGRRRRLAALRRGRPRRRRRWVRPDRGAAHRHRAGRRRARHRPAGLRRRLPSRRPGAPRLLEPDALSGQAGAYGAWRDAASARALAARDISASRSTSTSRCCAPAGRPPRTSPPPAPSTGCTARPLDLGGGIGDERPFFRSDLQPYTIHVPSCVEDGETPVLTLALHSLLGNHNQYRAASPGFYDQLGEDRCSIVVTTLGHGPDGWYLDEAEADLFAVLADVRARYEVDLGHTIVHGYSMGGYGTYRLVGRHPDLFAAAFPVVGPPPRASC